MSELQLVHSPAFRRRRGQNWVFLGLMYGFFYMSRYNLAAIAQGVQNTFGWNDTRYGTLLTAALAVYGASVFLNGPLADKMGGKRALLIGAGGAALFNLLFGLGHLLVVRPAVVVKGTVTQPAQLALGMSSTTALATMAALWAANNYFQSYGALSIVKVNAAWFHVSERGRFAGIFGIMIQSGRTLAFLVSPFLLAYLPWQWCFWVPSAILVVMFVAVRFLVENAPSDAGFDDLHTGDESAQEAAQPVTFGFVIRKVFASRTTWLIAFSSMCIGFVRNGIDQWWSKYMVTMFELDPLHPKAFAPYQVAAWLMPIAAVFGGLAAGNASDRLFGARRAPVILIAFIGQAACLVLLWRFDHDAWAGCLLLAAVSFFIQSAHSLVGGAASMDFGGRKAVATAAGFFDGAQYLAGALMSIPLGRMMDHFKRADHVEYTLWPLAPLPFAFIGAAVMARLWNARPGKSAHGGAVEEAVEAADAAIVKAS